VLEKRASLSDDTMEQKALSYRAADLYERVLAQPEKAIATWRHVLTLDEQDNPALGALERLYRQKGKAGGAPRDLAWVYGRPMEMAETQLERRPLWFSLAQVQEEAGEPQEAIVAYKGALADHGGDREAVDALVRLYQAERQWAELIESLDAAAALTGNPDER